MKLISAVCSLTFKDFQFLSKSCQMYRKIGSLLFRLSASVRYLHPHTITHRCGGISKNFLLFKSSYCRGRLLLKSENEARLQFSKGTLIRYLHTVTFTIFSGLYGRIEAHLEASREAEEENGMVAIVLLRDHECLCQKKRMGDKCS